MSAPLPRRIAVGCKSATRRIVPDTVETHVACAILGAFVLYCRLAFERRPIIRFLPTIAPHWKSRGAPTAELIVFSIIGGFLALVIPPPDKNAQAVAAGLGWTAILG